MTLREFVSDTLFQIVSGVQDARDTTEKIAPVVTDKNDNLRVNAVSNGRAFIVDFDVAVVVSQKTGLEAKGRVEIYVLDADIKRATSSEHITTSRIKFQVPITFDDDADNAEVS